MIVKQKAGAAYIFISNNLFHQMLSRDKVMGIFVCQELDLDY